MTDVPLRAWFTDAHAAQFDWPARLDRWNWAWHWSGFNYTYLVTPILSQIRSITEIGCATGEYVRYLRALGWRGAYRGYDVSPQALVRAARKLPNEQFELVTPGSTAFARAELAIAIDVTPHQPRPWDFLAAIYACAERAVLIKERTTDTCPSSDDWEKSCCFENGTWAPYMVLNTNELVEFFQRRGAEQVRLARHYMTLAGRGDRYLPKALYHPDARTAATSVLVVKDPTLRIGTERVVIENRTEHAQRRLWLRLVGRLRRLHH